MGEKPKRKSKLIKAEGALPAKPLAALSQELTLMKYVSASNVLLSIGLAFFYVWLIYHANAFGFQSSAFIFDGVVSYNAFSLLANAAMLFLLFVIYLRRRIVLFGVGYFVCVGALLAFGYFCGLLIEASSVSDPAFSAFVVVQCLMTNAGMTCLSLEWIRLLGSLGTRASTPMLVLSSFLAALVLWLVGFVEEVGFLSWLLPVFFPVISVVAIFVHYRRTNLLKSNKVRNYGSDSDLNIPYRLLATVFASDLVGAMIAAISSANGVHQSLGMNAVAFALSAILLAVSAGFWRFDFNGLIYKTAYLVMCVGCVAFSLPFAHSLIVGMGIHQVGYRFMLLVTWLMSVWLVERRQLSANWVYPVVTGVAFIGMFFGREIAALGIAFFGVEKGTVTLGVIGAVSLPVLALYLMGARNVKNDWGFSKPIGSGVAPNSHMDAACAVLAEDYGLTAREKDVFTLIAKGYTRKFISDQLVLSPETVKSYANKMYAKVGVHSRQDLIQRVNVKMEELEAKGYE